MKKLLALCIILTLSLTLAACGTKETHNAGSISGVSSNEALAQSTQETTQTTINNETIDEETAAAMQAELSGALPVIEGLPEGFPQSLPIYKDAQILEADAYGEHGYTVVYMVSVPYASVVSFYQKAFPDIQTVYDEPGECYFENFDIDGGTVHINGLTITDDDDYTAVFITLKYN